MPKRLCPVQQLLSHASKRVKENNGNSSSTPSMGWYSGISGSKPDDSVQTPEPLKSVTRVKMLPPHRLAQELVEAMEAGDIWHIRSLLSQPVIKAIPLARLTGLPEYLASLDIPAEVWQGLRELIARPWEMLISDVVEYALSCGDVEQARRIVDTLGTDPARSSLIRRPFIILRKALKAGQRDVVDFIFSLPNLTVDLNLGVGLPLRTAAIHGWVHAIKYLLSTSSVDPNARPRAGLSALSNATRYGHIEVIRLLLKDRRTNVHLDDEDALCEAAKRGHLDIVKLLLKCGANPGLIHSFPFRVACANGHIEVARLLAKDSRIKIDACDGEALMSTCFYGASDLVSALLRCRTVDPCIDGCKAIRIALERGHLEAARILLADHRIPPSAASSLLISAASSGLSEIVDELLKSGRASASASDQTAIRVACARGHTRTVELLLAVDGVDPSTHGNEALRESAKGGFLDIVKLLLAHPSVDPCAEMSEALVAASARGHYDIVKCLLSDGRADPAALSNLALRLALENSHDEVVLILAADPRVDLSMDNNRLFIIAADQGRERAVWGLLAHRKVNPAARNNAAICLAAQNGHLKVVKLLLADGRSDPSCEQNDPIRYASKNGHLAVVEALLEDPRVDPSDRDSEALLWAVQGAHADVMRALVEHSARTVDPAAGNHAYLMWAIGMNNVTVVGRLLNDPRVDPATNNDWPIREAARLGHANVVALLANEDRVNPSAVKCVALRDACRLGHTEVVRILLSQTSSDPTVLRNAPLRLACENGHEDIVNILLSDSRVRGTQKKNTMLVVAMEHGQPGALCVLIRSQHYCLRPLWIQLMRWACNNNNVSVVRALLENEDSRPDFDSDWAIRTSCENGYADIVDALLKDGRCHPLTQNFICFHSAVRSGCARIVNALININAAPSSAQQAVFDPPPLLVAVQEGHLDVFRLLLEHDQFLVASSLIVSAVTQNRIEMVRILLKDARVDPTVQGSRVLQVAASDNRCEITQLLLEDKRVDVKASDCLAFREAALRGHVNIVKMLLAEPNIDPRVMNDFALRQACERGHAAVVRLLLEDGRSDPALNNNIAIHMAARYHRFDVVRTLLTSPRVKRNLSSWLLYQSDGIVPVQSDMEAGAFSAAQVCIMVYKALVSHSPRQGGLAYHKDIILDILTFACADKLILCFSKLADVPGRARRLLSDLINIREKNSINTSS